MTSFSLSKKQYKQQSAELTEALLEAQFELRKAGKGPVLLLISGNDLGGKAEVIHTFYAWLDTRFLNTRAFVLPHTLEKRMPRMWRYWRSLPPAGELGFYLGSWYHQPLMGLSRGTLSISAFQRQMDDILRFEQLLDDEGAVVLKVWLHISPDGKSVTKSPDQLHYQDTVAMREWGDFSQADYEKVRSAAAQMIELTSTEHAPWIRIPSHDPHYRDIQIGQLLLKAMRRHLEQEASPAQHQSYLPGSIDRLSTLDYSAKLEKDDYQTQLEHYQQMLRELIRHPRFARRSLLLVFEGSDAAGKGGAIRRITQCLDPRYLRVHGTRAPTEEERTQPYLMRFWRRIPAPGTVVVFDRSYYGRVLVERVEGFCSAAEWQRAYGEINDFEQQLQQSNTLVIKFWLAITEEEQLARFQAREASALKRHKLTEEDWRNRKQWPAYQKAINDMLEFTDSRGAPWHVIAAEDKRHARIEVIRTLCETLQKALK
ncbi:MAG: polyphosphate:AMP phosphotransferase [Pseudoalteromonas distincta]